MGGQDKGRENSEWVAKMLGYTTIRMLQKYSKFIPNLTRRDGSAFISVAVGEVISHIAPSWANQGESDLMIVISGSKLQQVTTLSSFRAQESLFGTRQ